MKQFAKMHPAIQTIAQEVTKNAALGRVIQEASNPYHALHVARSFQLKTPKAQTILQPKPVMNDPWLMMKGKK